MSFSLSFDGLHFEDEDNCRRDDSEMDELIKRMGFTAYPFRSKDTNDWNRSDWRHKVHIGDAHLLSCCPVFTSCNHFYRTL